MACFFYKLKHGIVGLASPIVFFYRLYGMLLLIAGASGTLHAQQHLAIQASELLPRGIRIPLEYADTSALQKGVVALADSLQREGFLAASIDSLWRSGDSTWTARLTLGVRYTWGNFDVSRIPDSYLRESRFRRSHWQHQPVTSYRLRDWQQRLTAVAAQQGYPFARTGLDSLRSGDGRLDAHAWLDSGPRILFDTLNQEGALRIPFVYLQRVTGIIPGQVYDQRLILRLKERLRGLPFAVLTRDPEVDFIGTQASVRLTLAPRQASRMDFVIGVLPSVLNTGKLQFSATFFGDLLNQFGAGERMTLRFEQLRPLTQRLELQVSRPALWHTPLGVDVRSNLYKRDSAALDADLHIGVSWLSEGADYLRLFWSVRSSRILSWPSSVFAGSPALPNTLDYNARSLGMEFRRQQLDYAFNPRRGWQVQVALSAGGRQVLRNPQVTERGWGFLYDSLDTGGTLLRLETRIGVFIPLWKRSTLYATLHSKGLYSARKILDNEHYYLGGSQTLRGFEEDYFSATRFMLGTLEYRFLIGENAWLYTFVDAARLVSAGKIRYPLGTGAGLTLETRAGIIGLSMGYGIQAGLPTNIYSPKVHIGYVSLF